MIKHFYFINCHKYVRISIEVFRIEIYIKTIFFITSLPLFLQLYNSLMMSEKSVNLTITFYSEKNVLFI